MRVRCIACGNREHGHLCGSCGTILPLQDEVDYFSVLGLKRRLRIDPDELKETFHRLSGSIHPDRHVQKSLEERRIAFERSVELNNAYHTLRDRLRRATYLVEIETATPIQKGTNAVNETFFDLVVEVNEAAAAVRGGEESVALEKLEALEARVEHAEERALASLGELEAEWDRGAARLEKGERKALAERVRQKVADILYLRRLASTIREAPKGEEGEFRSVL